MSWPRYKRRSGVDGAAELIAKIGSRREVARLAGVSVRLVQKWSTGELAPTYSQLLTIIEGLLPLCAGGSMLSGVSNECLESGTILGVGEYSLRMSYGQHYY